MPNTIDRAMSATTAALVALSEEPRCLLIAAMRLEDALVLVRQAQADKVRAGLVGTMTRQQTFELLRSATDAREWDLAVCAIQAAFGSFPDWLRDEQPRFGNFVHVRKIKDKS